MSNKSKGSRTERELLDLFTEHGWRAARVAGSGTNENTYCDLIAGKNGKGGFAVECKSSKKKIIYISKEQVNDFIIFSNLIGLEPVVAVRFNREGWLFLNPEVMKDTGKYWAISLELAKSSGKRFSQFFD